MTAPRRTEVPAYERLALVTVETVERLTAKASEALEAGDLDRVRALFGAIVDETSARTATAVKVQDVSDSIAADAAMHVRGALALVDVQLQEEAARLAEAAAQAKDRRDREEAADADYRRGLITAEEYEQLTGHPHPAITAALADGATPAEAADAAELDRLRDLEAAHEAETERAIADHERDLDARDDQDWHGRHGL